MALSLGELTGFISLEDDGFTRTLQAGEAGIRRLESTVNTATSSLATTADADMQRMARAVDEAFDEILREATDLGPRLQGAMDQALGQAGAGAGEHGRRAGAEFAQGAEDAGRSGMPRLGDTLMTAVKGLGWAAAGAAIGAALMSGLESALEADKAIAKLSAQVGAFGPESENLGRIAGSLYTKGYGESMDEVTGAIASVIQNIDGMRNASDEALRSVSARAMEAAKILDEDVGRVTAAVSQMLRTGMAKSAEEAFDIIVKGAQEGVNKSGDLLDTFNEYSTEFRALGLDGQTALGLINQALQAGARDADVAADAIKEFAIEAVAGGDRVRKGFEAIGLNADEMVAKFAAGGPTAAQAFDLVLDRLRAITDPAERNAAAIELFGTKAEDLQGALYAMDPSTAVQSLGQVAGAAAQAGQALQDNAATKVEAFKRTLEQGIVQFLGGTVIPAIEGLWQAFTSSDVASSIGGVVEQIKGFFSGIFEDIASWVEQNKTTFQEWGNAIGDAFNSMGEIVGAALDIIKGLWDQWGSTILSALQTLVSTLLGVWQGLWNSIKGVFNTFAGLFTGDWQRVGEGLKQIWDGLWKAVESILKGALELVLNLAKSAWEKLKSAAQSAWDGLKNVVKTTLDAVINFMKNLPGQILAHLKNAGTLLVQVGRDLITGLLNGIKEMASRAVEAVKGVVDDAIQAAKNLLGISSPSKVAALEIGAPIVEGIAAGIITAEGQLITTAQQTAAKAVSTLKANVGGSKGAGELIIIGIVGGVDAKSKDLLNKITKLLQQVIKTAKSPVEKGKTGTKPTGHRIAEGVAEGIKEKQGAVMQAVHEMVSKAKSTAAKAVKEVVGMTAKLTKAKLPEEPKLVSDLVYQPQPVQYDPYSATWPGAGSTGSVNVTIQQATVREDADITRIGAEFAYQVAARG